MRSSFFGLIIVIAALYFSGAGNWVMQQLQIANERCYGALSAVSSELASPVCQAVSTGLGAITNGISSVGDKVAQFKQRIVGSSLDSLDMLASEMESEIRNYTSSADSLARMVSLGPNHPQLFSTNQPFKNALDSFVIGQSMYQNPATRSSALGWLQRGARQPQGLGVLSQLALGNLYAHGGAGVSSNPSAAVAYLREASRSIDMLSTSESPDSKQILKLLPASPEQMQREIKGALRELSLSVH